MYAEQGGDVCCCCWDIIFYWLFNVALLPGCVHLGSSANKVQCHSNVVRVERCITCDLAIGSYVYNN